MPSLYLGKEHSCLWRQRDTKKNPNQPVLLSFPQFTPVRPHALWLGLPRWLEVKPPPAAQEPWVQPIGQEDTLEKEMATHSSILEGKLHGSK